MSKLKIIKDAPQKPRNPHLFKKGQSGNPAGRPKRAIDLAVKAAAFDDEVIEMYVTIIRDKKASRRDKLMAGQALLDRGFGRPSQSVMIGGDPDGAPVATTHLTPEQYADIVAAAKEVDDDV